MNEEAVAEAAAHLAAAFADPPSLPPLHPLASLFQSAPILRHVSLAVLLSHDLLLCSGNLLQAVQRPLALSGTTGRSFCGHVIVERQRPGVALADR